MPLKLLSRREVGRSISLQKIKGPPAPYPLRGARMFATIASIVIALILVYNGYLVFYAKSGRYAQDQRFDAYTKR